MYLVALYIGLGTLVFTHLYFTVIPDYAWQIQHGALADEAVWWHSIQQGPWRRVDAEYVATALLFGLGWTWSLFQAEQVSTPFLYSVHDVFIWLGLLLLLARTDHACLLLPDVLTQSLLWWGLLQLSLASPHLLTNTVWAMAIIYIGGRLFQFFGNLCFAMPLVGLGDVKLLVAVTPWLGAHAIIYVVCGACLGCFVFQACQQRRWRPTGSCAFGPYLVGASWLVGWLAPPALSINS